MLIRGNLDIVIPVDFNDDGGSWKKNIIMVLVHGRGLGENDDYCVDSEFKPFEPDLIDFGLVILWILAKAYMSKII